MQNSQSLMEANGGAVMTILYTVNMSESRHKSV